MDSSFRWVALSVSCFPFQSVWYTFCKGSSCVNKVFGTRMSPTFKTQHNPWSWMLPSPLFLGRCGVDFPGGSTFPPCSTATPTSPRNGWTLPNSWADVEIAKQLRRKPCARREASKTPGDFFIHGNFLKGTRVPFMGILGENCWRGIGREISLDSHDFDGKCHHFGQIRATIHGRRVRNCRPSFPESCWSQQIPA